MYHRKGILPGTSERESARCQAIVILAAAPRDTRCHELSRLRCVDYRADPRRTRRNAKVGLARYRQAEHVESGPLSMNRGDPSTIGPILHTIRRCRLCY